MAGTIVADTIRADSTSTLLIQTGSSTPATAISIDTSQNVSVNQNLLFNSGYGSAATAYGCRAWAAFTPSTGTVLASGNMTSVARNSAGNYTATFTNAMPDENYAMALGIANDTAGNSRNYYGVTSKTASAYRFSVNANGVAADPPNMSVAIFR